MKKRVLVLGQTPPPYGGQAAMVQALLDGQYEDVELFHVRINYGSGFNNLGKMSAGKIFKTFGIVGQVWAARFKHKTTVLYFPPSGAKLGPLLRDIALLLPTRWLFKQTMFHFHAGGISEGYERLPGPAKTFFRRAFDKPDVAMRISSRTPEDAKFIHTKHEVILPNGLDAPLAPRLERTTLGMPVTLLYVAIITEDKGFLDALECLRLLKSQGGRYRMRVAGEYSDDAFRERAEAIIREQGLQEDVEFLGLITGDKKWETFRDADIFVFPTYFTAETFGMVVVEAMAMGTPVVGSTWRGVPDIIQDGENGLLVEPRDPAALARAVRRIVDDPEMRQRFSLAGRATYEARYTLDSFRRRMDDAFRLLF